MVKRRRDNRANWQFVLDAEGASWSWQRTAPDNTVEHSERSFGSLPECAAHAATRGYAQWKNDERREVRCGRDALLLAD
jgi:hypothetical protein